MKKLTMANGRQVEDNQNSVIAGERDPVLMQDVLLMEKLAHVDREDNESVPDNIVRLQLSYFMAADKSYGTGIAKHLGIHL